MALTNLNKKLNSIDRKSAGKAGKRDVKKLATRIAIVLVILFVVLYLPIRGVYQSSKQVMQSGRKVALGAKQENLDTIRQGIVETKQSVSGLNTSLNFLFWVGLVPYFGGFYGDAKHFAKAAEYELEAAIILADSLDPYKNELSLVGNPTPGQDRVSQAVKILDKTLPNLDKVEPLFKKARQEVEGVDTGKYPEKFGSTALRGRMEVARNFIVGAHVAVSENRSLIESLPELLGQKGAKNYLLLFQNDKELRATGGFVTAYAFLRLDNGHLSTTASDDIYRLDERLLKACQKKICPITPPAPIIKYLPEANGKPRTAWSMRDSNLSPDLPVSMQQFERMYGMLGDNTQFDGIITIDTQVVEEIIAVTGPVDVFGTTYSAEKDKRCNCPNVIYELEKYAEVTAKGEEDRKAVLGALMQQIMAKLLTSGTDKLPTLLNTGIKLAGDKHIMYYMHNGKIQQSFAKLNWTGEINKNFSGEYLHINDSNFAGGKSNLYVDEKVSLESNVAKDGSVKNKLTIEYKNPQPYNTWLNGILRDYVRVYVPRGSVLVKSEGSDETVATQEDSDLNKTYFEAFVVVRPQNSRILTLEYTTPVKVTGKTYPILIQKQPGAKDHKYTIKINGGKKSEFHLIADKQFNLSF